MKLKNNRTTSFITVGIIYIIEVGVGAITYCMLPYTFWLKLLLADVVATVVTFVFSLIFHNASVYDPYWSVQPFVIIVAFTIAAPKRLTGILLLVVICFWSIRLTANWAYTFHGLIHQDWRYTMLYDKTGKWYPIINFLGIHMVPTLIVYLCILPAVFVTKSEAKLNVGYVLALCISFSAVALQGVSDIQLHCFRHAQKKGFIRTGAWRYSRHPNYLGEILMWWGVGLASVAVMPGKWYLLAGAFFNTCLFVFVSIPMADKHQARKEGFVEYKSHTRMLLPIPKE